MPTRDPPGEAPRGDDSRSSSGRCAGIAIACRNDIPTAREYLKQWLTWEKAAGTRKIDEELEKRWWPRQWEQGGAKPSDR